MLLPRPFELIFSSRSNIQRHRATFGSSRRATGPHVTIPAWVTNAILAEVTASSMTSCTMGTFGTRVTRPSEPSRRAATRALSVLGSCVSLTTVGIGMWLCTCDHECDQRRSATSHCPPHANQQRIEKQAGNSRFPAYFRVSRRSAKPPPPVQIRAAPPLPTLIDTVTSASNRRFRRRWSRSSKCPVRSPGCC